MEVIKALYSLLPASSAEVTGHCVTESNIFSSSSPILVSAREAVTGECEKDTTHVKFESSIQIANLGPRISIALPFSASPSSRVLARRPDA